MRMGHRPTANSKSRLLETSLLNSNHFSASVTPLLSTQQQPTLLSRRHPDAATGCSPCLSLSSRLYSTGSLLFDCSKSSNPNSTQFAKVLEPF